MRVIDNLKLKQGNYILPFFWQHGEEEAKLREYMNAIKNANIDEVCLEARPHPDFAGEQWFKDFDIILDEAKKLDMKIWILDDAHFPSGQAAGKMEQYPEHLCKTYLNYNLVDICGPVAQTEIEIEKMAHYYDNPFSGNSHPFFNSEKREFTEPEKLFAVVAAKLDGQRGDNAHICELLDLTDQVVDGKLVWDVPEGYYRIFVVYETHKGGGRDGAINFLSKESCRIQLETCYEPHLRYQEEFGKTILGFFSDEPEIGNIPAYDTEAGRIGNMAMPLPWSEEMPALMAERFGDDYKKRIVGLWFHALEKEDSEELRVGYMDIVSRLCQKNFGEQMGEWCREHGLLYIGHIVEDNGASTGLAASQGHYFRALWGQDWSGVDNIGGQITFGGENILHKAFTGLKADGEFYHHEIGKLGVSLADIDPKKNGNTMCETFGAYGWEEGTRLMTYEANHLLARGVNRYVPHAFSPKEFPDFDCPPHFYAHGKNPLYKPFGTLMQYMNRVSHIISGGSHEVSVAVLYHAESVWADAEYLDCGVVGRYLDDAQIDYDYIPADVFADPEAFHSYYDEDGLHINGHVFTALVLPGLEYITEETEAFLNEAKETDFLVLFAERVPAGLGEDFVATELCELAEKLTVAGVTDALLAPKFKEIEIYHYAHDEEDYYLINNESAYKFFTGRIVLPALSEECNPDEVYRYDAWTNTLYATDLEKVTLAPYEMMIVVVPKTKAAANALQEAAKVENAYMNQAKAVTTAWKTSFCLNENYPQFADEISLEELKNINFIKKDWSGVIRYENQICLDAKDIANKEGFGNCLEIEEAFESVEVWVNGTLAGERICPPYRVDVTGLLKEGTNDIRIECRTTLERLVHGITGGMSFFGPEFLAVQPSGILGKVVIR